MGNEKKLSSSEAAMLPENEAKIAEFKRRAEADDARNETVGKLFDPVALLQRAGQIHEAQHPTLGLIRYGELVIADSEIINKCKNKAGFFVNQIANWIKHSSDAENIGLVLSTFPQFNFISLRELTVFQFNYLVAWAKLHQVKVRQFG